MGESLNTPTLILVHGGFADASFWAPVIKDLQAHNVPVLAPPNPLRGLAHDAEYIASYVNQVDGPVLLVGHSYGGAVISVAGASTPNAVGLVYVAAFALDEGESFADIFARFGDTPLVKSVEPSTYPLPNGQTAVELHDQARALPIGVRRRPAKRRDGRPGRQPAPIRRDLRRSRPGCSLAETALVGDRGYFGQRHPAGCRAPHGATCPRAGDRRGRRLALDRAFAANRGCGVDSHRRRGDLGGR
jgi:pimeloyl-ACP methyl ester carboxylesterase